ncbi:MAG: efflux RND transporter periplasmic adaptor subunit [Defluviitaleaceae bacterium]|nr:efflux RND transporter periplasmic adaptor subunit [Defluviitaleaceae bacterium]
MNSAIAIYIKQFQDILKNSGVLTQFIVFPVMAFMMTYIIDVSMPGMPESFFIDQFAAMFVGMALIGATATVIAEDREKNSLRFLMMAGIKSHEYLLGIGGIFFTFATVGCIAFAVMMPNVAMTTMLLMLASLMMGALASILLGAAIGMVSKSEQEAISYGSLAGLIAGFGPMIANMSGNETLERIFRVLYTMNFIDEHASRVEALQSIGIIFANIIAFAIAFGWVYSKQESSKKGGITLNKKTLTAMAAAAVIGIAVIGGAIWHNAGFLTTDNASVATTLIPISASTPGVLERFAITEGQHIRADEILGWIEGGEAMRSPIDGLVIQTSAIQGQAVSTMEPIAILSDINNLHIQTYIEETDIARIHVGQAATVTIDSLGNQRFNGYISEIGHATSAALAGQGMFINMNGSMSRVTRMIPIKINMADDVNLASFVGVNASVRIPVR